MWASEKERARVWNRKTCPQTSVVTLTIKSDGKLAGCCAPGGRQRPPGCESRCWCDPCPPGACDGLRESPGWRRALKRLQQDEGRRAMDGVGRQAWPGSMERGRTCLPGMEDPAAREESHWEAQQVAPGAVWCRAGVRSASQGPCLGPWRPPGELWVTSGHDGEPREAVSWRRELCGLVDSLKAGGTCFGCVWV